MEFFDVLNTRRSVRSFTDRPLSIEEVETLLHAACMAPSARNLQPWRFVVVDRRDLLDEIARRHPYAGFANKAPLAIVVCGVPQEASGDFWVQDCAAATQNLLLAARALDLGAVWCGLYPVEDRAQLMRDILGIPADVQPLSLVIVGHTEKAQHMAEREFASKTSHNAWKEQP